MKVLTTLATFLAIGAAADAQDPKRVPLPASGATTTARPQPDTRQPLPTLVEVTEVLQDTQLGDEPDFVPAEDILDEHGDSIGVKPVGNPYTLSFVNGDYEPKRGIDMNLVDWLKANPGRETYGFVMIRGRTSEAKMKRLQAAGLKLYDAHTWQSVKARIPLKAIPLLARMEFVHWVGYARPEQKYDRGLGQIMKSSDVADDQRIEIYVNLFDSDLGADQKRIVEGRHTVLSAHAVEAPITYTIPNGPFQKALEKLGFEFMWYDESIWGMRGYATKAQIRKIRALHFVHNIELAQNHETCHDTGMAMVSQDRVRGAYPGSKVPIGVIDTGIDSTPWHQDFNGKSFWAWRATNTLPNSYQDGNGHGTHVSGTVFGTGKADKRYTGAAPAVGHGGEGDRIYIGRYLDDGGSSKGNVQNLYDVFKTSLQNGGKTNPRPTLINCSWGSNSSSGYDGTDSGSRKADAAVYDNNQLYVFAAGNKKSTANWFASAPGAAKNVLTVGGIQDWWNSTRKAGDIYQSSRYGTKDNRRKPEVCGVADSLTSCNINTSTGYTNKSGTSMATPMVVGCLASVVDRDPNFAYKPAALKAAAVASALVNGSANYDTKKGWGTINSYKMNYAGNTTYQVWTGSHTKDGNYTNIDVKIESNVEMLRVVLAWIEPNASAAATVARKNDMRFYVDIPPYSGGGNTGEYSASSSRNTVLTLYSNNTSSSGMAGKARGKTVRFKVYAQDIKTGSKTKWALVVFRSFKKMNTGSSNAPSVSATASTLLMKPGATTVIKPQLNALSTGDAFGHGRLWVESSPSGFSMTRIERTTADNILQVYTGSGHKSFPSPEVKIGSGGGMVVGQGRTRRISYTLKAPNTSGSYTLTSKGVWHGTTTKLKFLSACVDGKKPNTITGLTSTTHQKNVWSNKKTFTAKWNAATDDGCAGIKGLSRNISFVSTTPSAVMNQAGDPKTYSTNLPDTKTGWWFNIRAVDKINNWGNASHFGPIKIDTVKPVVNSVVIDSGALYTKITTMSVKVTAFDGTSGLKQMRYSLNNSNWSIWYTYTTAARNIGMSLWGGNTNPGVKTVYVQVRDNANNISTTKADSIIYRLAPTLTKGTIVTLPAVNHGFYRFEGKNLLGTKSVSFGGKTISTKWTSANDDAWAEGSFRVFASGVLYVYPPQGMPVGTYLVKVNDGVWTSNGINVAVTKNTNRVVRSHTTLTAGKTMTLMCTLGNLPQNTKGVLVLSPLKQPSVLQGIVSLGIGANWTAFFELPPLTFNNAGILALNFPTQAAWKGLSGHMQMVYLTPGLPLPVSDIWSIALK